MIVQTKLTKSEYRNACLAVVWSKTAFKIFFSVYLVIVVINIFSSVYRNESVLPVIVPPFLIVGIVYFLFNFSLNRSYKNNKRVNENTEYHFDDPGLVIVGESFRSELSWDKLFKVTKTKKWLLLWHNSQIANAIPLNLVSVELSNYLKEILEKNNVKNNL